MEIDEVVDNELWMYQKIPVKCCQQLQIFH